MALSVRQPWAWLIVADIYTEEYRQRRTNRRGTILIHASRNQSECDPASLDAIEQNYACKLPDLDFGGIIGAVDIVGCREVDAHGSGRPNMPGFWPARVNFRFDLVAVH